MADAELVAAWAQELSSTEDQIAAALAKVAAVREQVRGELEALRKRRAHLFDLISGREHEQLELPAPAPGAVWEPKKGTRLVKRIEAEPPPAKPEAQRPREDQCEAKMRSGARCRTRINRGVSNHFCGLHARSEPVAEGIAS